MVKDLRYYDAILDGDIVIPMWSTFSNGDIIVTYGNDESCKSIHIVNEIQPNGVAKMYATELGKNFVVASIQGEILNVVKAPHVRLANNQEKLHLFDLLKEKGYRWNEANKKLLKISE